MLSQVKRKPEARMNEIIVLFYAFARVGILGFGGGQSIVPLIQVEVVDNYRWMTVEEFTHALAMANSLPGPITTKMSVFTGYKVAGLVGALAGILGLVLPSLVLMLLVGSFYLAYLDLPAVKGALKALRPVVLALLVLVVYNIFPVSVNSWSTALIAVTAFGMMAFLNVHPFFVITGAALTGVLFYR
jgi:chromate transporter